MEHCKSVFDIIQYLLRPGGNFIFHVPAAIVNKVRELMMTSPLYKSAGLCLDLFPTLFVLTNDSSRYAKYYFLE